jgi:hypothetical protein
MTASRATPVPDALTEPFWAAARRRTLVAQRCPACQQWQHPPRPACFACDSADVEFTPLSGLGTVLTWTEVRQPFVADWRDELPFTCFLVETAEGLVFPSDDLYFFRRQGRGIELSAGLPVRADFEPVGEDLLLPQFVPAEV